MKLPFPLDIRWGIQRISMVAPRLYVPCTLSVKSEWNALLNRVNTRLPSIRRVSKLNFWRTEFLRASAWNTSRTETTLRHRSSQEFQRVNEQRSRFIFDKIFRHKMIWKLLRNVSKYFVFGEKAIIFYRQIEALKGKMIKQILIIVLIT